MSIACRGNGNRPPKARRSAITARGVALSSAITAPGLAFRFRPAVGSREPGSPRGPARQFSRDSLSGPASACRFALAFVLASASGRVFAPPLTSVQDGSDLASASAPDGGGTASDPASASAPDGGGTASDPVSVRSLPPIRRTFRRPRVSLSPRAFPNRRLPPNPSPLLSPRASPSLLLRRRRVSRQLFPSRRGRPRRRRPRRWIWPARTSAPCRTRSPRS